MDVVNIRRKRLKHWLDTQYDGVQTRFASECSINAGELSGLLDKKSFGEKRARSLEKQAGMPPNWLDQLEGGAIKDSEISSKSREINTVLIPQFNTAGKMGDGFYLSQTAGVIESWRVSPEWLRANVPHCTSPKNLAIVTGLGDSMTGIFNNGDPVLVDRGVIQADHDGVYFFRVGCEGFIKRLQRIPGEGILVMSENKSYKEWYIRPADDFEVFGRVLKAWEGKGF